jgi:hypothetical protein
VKRSGLNENAALFGRQGTDDTNTLDIRFGGDKLRLANFNSYLLETSQEFRDLSAWFHLMIVLDTTQATANNRARMYMNGLEITQFNARTNPTQNADLAINTATLHHLGATVSGGNPTYYFNGYLADIYFIDGQALTPSSFTETDATTGQLIPKAYTGSYGTNGFHLEFADNSAATATTLGKDTSGNGNNWTPNNLSVTAGAGNDSVIDVPTNGAQTDTGVGGEVRGNYCTLNPLSGSSNGILTNGNLDYSCSVNSTHRFGTFGVSSGKWYWETTLTSAPSGVSNLYGPGISDKPLETGATYTGNRIYIHSNGNKFNGATMTESAYGASFTNGDVIGVALDLDGGTLVFYKNGVSQGTAFSGLTGTWFPLIRTDATASGAWNFGQRPFAYTAPSGFKALCTANLPAPLVTKPNTVMDVVTYTGTGAALTPTSSLGFNPDWIWIKSRSAATDHALYDVVRGAQARLESNTTDAEVTTDGGVTAFNSAGFTLGTLAQVNTSAATYVAWCWDAGTSTVSNTQGSITSSVRANATAGFSVVTYTGNGASSGTIGHGLGVAPSLIIRKSRSATDSWFVYHRSIGATKYILLQSTTAEQTSIDAWNDTAPSSTVFSNGKDGILNGTTYVAYCFAPVVGYSSFGSYTGNGSSTDGPFVYTGFRPRWVIVKRTDSTASWQVFDAARNTYNALTSVLFPNTADAEASNSVYAFDFISNGFKVRSSQTQFNASGGTYIYAAFAESPFNYARAR